MQRSRISNLSPDILIRKMIKRFFNLCFLLIALIIFFVICWRFFVDPRLLSNSVVTSEVDMLYAGCIQDMVSNTCKVMGNGSVGVSMDANASNVIFVAGVGAIDAKIYQEIYSYGADMCKVVKTDCAENWNGKQCKIARALYRH